MNASMAAYGLINNPFPLIPDAHVFDWAGRPEVKKLLLDIATSVRYGDIGLSEFVILHGDWGAGKSHALRYLETAVNETRREEFGSLAVYMAKIKIGPKLSFLELYRRILQEITTERILGIAESIRVSVDSEAERLSEELPSADVKKIYDERGSLRPVVVEKLPGDDQAMVRLLLRVADEDREALSFITAEAAPPRDSGYSQAIKTDYDAIHVFTDFIRAATSPIGEGEPALRAFDLFIDEAEDALQAKASEQSELWGAIRELVNRVPYRMALLIAFTAEAAFLEAVMPEAVLERTTRQNIELQALGIDDAKGFVREHLANHRPAEFSSDNPYYPFEESAIELVFEREPILVPRKIFRNLRQVLERAIKRQGLEPGEAIDAGLAAEIVENLRL